MVQEFTFPQNYDRDDAEHFASMIGQANLSDFVESGLEFTYDATVPSVDVSQGKAFISLDTDTAETSGEEILDVNRVVQVPTQTVSLSTGAVNYVYLEPNFESNDAATVGAYTTEQTGTSLLIGTVDTSADEATELNRNPVLSAKQLGLGDDADSYVWEYNSSEGALTLEDDTGTRLASVDSTTLDISVDLQDAAGNVIYNQSGNYVEQARLENSSVTVAGNSVSLGGSADISHGDLSGVSSDQHHAQVHDNADHSTNYTAQGTFDTHTGDASAHHTKYTDSEAVTAVNNDTDHGSTASHNYFSGSHTDLTNVSSDDHHVRYTDSDAQNAINNDADHGSTASHNYFSGSHGDLSNVSSADHHAKYTDSEAITAINNDPNHGSNANHNYFKGNHNDLSNVGPSDHHTRYTDSEAVAAINNDTDHGSTASHNYFSGSHADLTNIGASDHHTKYTDSEAIAAINNDADHGSTAAHNYFSGSHADLTNVAADDHHTRYTDEEVYDAVDFLMVGGEGITLSYDDTNNSLTISGPGTYSDEQAQDAVGNMLSDNFTYDDSGNTINMLPHVGDSTAHHARYSDEEVYDAVDNLLVGGTGVTLNYDDPNNSLIIDGPEDFNDEDAQDAVGRILSSSFNYDDANGSIDITPHLGNASAHHARYSDEEVQDAVNQLLTGGIGISLTYDDTNNELTIDNSGADELAQDAVGQILSSDFTYDDATPEINMDPHASDASAHHAPYTDSDAQTAINNDGDHGSTAPHNYFSGSHSDLTGVGTSDHHAKYTDSEARAAVEGDVDAADLTGGSGTSGQVLQTDGTNVSWADAGGSNTSEVVSNLSIRSHQVIDVGNNGFPGDQSGGDLAQWMADQISAGGSYIFVLPEGTYNWDRPLLMTGGSGTHETPMPEHFAIVGKPNATLLSNMPTGSERLFFRFGLSSNGFAKARLENIHFDVGNASDARDAGIMRAYISDEARFKNLSISKRKRIQDDGSTYNGDRHTFKLDCIEQDAMAWVEDVRFANGDVFQGGSASVGHAIPFASEPTHVGTNYFVNCYVEGFTDNGFYLRDGPGSNYLLGCTAKNCSAGMFRLGRNDYAENITAIADSNLQYNGTPLWVQEYRSSVPDPIEDNQDQYVEGDEDSAPIVVNGFELLATGGPINDVIRISTNTTETRLEGGYVRNRTDNYILDATYDYGDVTVDDMTVDDHGTGSTRIAAFNISANNVTFRNLTYRALPPDGSNGRSVFNFRAQNTRVTDSRILGSYTPMIETGAGADFTVENTVCEHDGSYTDPYVLRNNDTNNVGNVQLRNNDMRDYTGGISNSSISANNFHIKNNRGIDDSTYNDVYTNVSGGVEIVVDGSDGTGVLNIITGTQ